MNDNKKDIGISVDTLFQENKKKLKLRILSGKTGCQRLITERDIHRPGLALAGFVDMFSFQRIQIFGNTEISYMKKMEPQQREKAFKQIFAFDIPCFLVTNNSRLPNDFRKLADEYEVPVFTTPFTTTKVIQVLGDFLDEKFAPQAYIHGSLVDVYGIGILITGRSGIGKSEVALDLVSRGHRLIVDDIVTICRRMGGLLIGTGNKTLRYHMEIRGLGIIDVQSIFGIRAIRRQKRVEVQVELVDWDKCKKVDRTGLEEKTKKILGEKIPAVLLPIYPGKNISVIIEVIALNHLMKIHGIHSAKEFEDKLTKQMSKKIKEMKDYLGRDFE